MKKKLLSPEALAALHAQVPGETEETEEQEEGTAQAAESDTADEASELAEVSAKLTEVESQLTEKTAEFAAQLAEKDAAIAAITAEKADVEAKLADSGKFRAIVEEHFATMRVAMKLADVDVSKMSDASLHTEYKALASSFEKSFNEGSLVPPPKNGQSQEPVQSRNSVRAINSLGF